MDVLRLYNPKYVYIYAAIRISFNSTIANFAFKNKKKQSKNDKIKNKKKKHGK